MSAKSVLLQTLGLALTLNGCAGGGAGPLGLGAVIGDRNLAAAEPLFSKAEEHCLGSADQLLGLIYGPASRTDDTRPPLARSGCEQLRTTMRYVLTRAGGASPTPTPAYDVAQRNEIMDALLATSNRKCTRYVALLKNADGVMNSTLSVGAILSGGLGSFLGGPATAKALAGTASILSGSRAAINETYLSNQTIQVLAAAFEKARRDQRRTITNRQACPIDQYTLMRGIEDALSYHNSCSLVVGLAETARAIERSENPGLDVMRAQLAELTNLRRQADALTKDGPITPIAPSSTPPSLDKLVAADGKLATAEATLAAARRTEAGINGEVTAAQAVLDAGGNAAPVALAKTRLAAATAAALAAETARNNARLARNAEVLALVRVTPEAAGTPLPEERACPYRRQS